MSRPSSRPTPSAPAGAALLLLLLAPALPAQAAPDTFVLAKQAFLENDLASASSLLDAAVRIRPRDADRRAWRADAARRMEDAPTALAEAREALRLDPCNSFAHEVVASLHNPQFRHMALQSDDSTRAHLEAAVRCDPANGSAWMSLWIQSLRQDDPADRRRTLEGLQRSGIITPSWYAHARWVLRSLPPRAIALAAGDIDTYPAAVAQGVEGLRPDVALVNTSMLNIDYAVRYLVKAHGLPLPPSLRPDSLEYRAREIIAYWRGEAAAGRLGRPLVVLHSLGLEYAESGPGTPTLAGPYWTIGDGPAIDTAAVAAAYRLADAADLSGPFLAANDRSPVRAANAFPPALMLGYLVGYEAGALGGLSAARAAWLDAALRRAGVAGDRSQGVRQWLRAFPAR